MSKIFIPLTIFFAVLLFCPMKGNTQEYKLRQVHVMQNAKMETTVYVKGKRQRVEGTAEGIGMNITVIEQCDLKRTIKLNDKKKLYYIEPFETGAIQQDRQEKEPITAKQEKIIKKGGVITMWLDVQDTGERKKMFGFTARHVWSTEKIKPSTDACSMRDSMLRKTDGWYIELPLYECHRDYIRVKGDGDGNQEVYCQDKYVQHTSGKGKIGFPLYEKSTMIMGGGNNEIVTTIETVELSTAKLDTMLFTIPPGYQRVNREEDLFDLTDISSAMRDKLEKENNQQAIINKDQKAPGKIRIGVYTPTGNNEVQAGMLQQKLISAINAYNMEAIAINGAEDAKTYNCDYTLNTVFTNIKPETKVGGIIKAIRKRDPNAAETYNIQGNLTLLSVKDGSEKSKQIVDGKYEGRIDEAASKALGEACQRVLVGLR